MAQNSFEKEQSLFCANRKSTHIYASCNCSFYHLYIVEDVGIFMHDLPVCNRFRTRSIPHSHTCYVEPRILLSSTLPSVVTCLELKWVTFLNMWNRFYNCCSDVRLTTFKAISLLHTRVLFLLKRHVMKSLLLTIRSDRACFDTSQL